MKSPIQCFLIEKTNQAIRSYRRYSRNINPSSSCEFHSSSRVIGAEPSGEFDTGFPPSESEKLDSRWPKTCSCGYEFQEEDHWQVNVDSLWTRTDNGDNFTLDKAPPGSMYYAEWYESSGIGPDGKHLVVVTPAGHWLLDQKSHSWTRTGTIPRITASPSILFRAQDGKELYHAHLIDGVLVPC
jgi:hypothetical protein